MLDTAGGGIYLVVLTPLSWCAACCAGNCDSQPLAVAINSATAQGIICAAASGNEAHSDALIIPACASKAVSVGAVYPETVGPAGQYSVCSDDLPQPDNIACFSNRCASRLSCGCPPQSIRSEQAPVTCDPQLRVCHRHYLSLCMVNYRARALGLCSQTNCIP
jgi:hypothetical protein